MQWGTKPWSRPSCDARPSPPPPHVDRDVLAGQVCHAYVAQRIDEAAAFNYIESSGRPT
ncbi:hypothetical protein [Streptomyces sp. NPDC048473]|uniref:hypothetical protein n=1 Tax=unclassified Streptomyces TaxID=2593676 RepID=UPI00371E2690